MRKNPRVDLDKVGHKDIERIDKRINQIESKDGKIKYLQMCIDVYCKLSNKLISRRERDHYTDVQRYCEAALKQVHKAK